MLDLVGPAASNMTADMLGGCDIELYFCNRRVILFRWWLDDTLDRGYGHARGFLGAFQRLKIGPWLSPQPYGLVCGNHIGLSFRGANLPAVLPCTRFT